MSKNLLIVESPTKTKTIKKYLGKDYEVLSSFGHIRDLPKSKMGVDTEGDFEPTYTIPTRSKPHVTALKKAAKAADTIYLATDGDREGEAIAWHVAEILKLNEKNSKRIIFHEITKHAIEKALENPGVLNMDLVNAQQARRILDRLVGYELSPLLWKKVRRGLSAGRVQSVAVRLVVDREAERDAFVVDEYWSVDANFSKDKTAFEGKLVSVKGEKLKKLSIGSEGEAQAILDDLKNANYTVGEVKKHQASKKPPAPFTTSSLQMAANQKLGYSAKQTMRLAQKLYETGRITYMRTDSLTLADKFLGETQDYVKQNLGDDYAKGAQHYKTKKKGAQEAHEAIRPTHVDATPDSIKAGMDPMEWKVYDLIWRRTVASQLPPAKVDRTSVDIEANEHIFRSTGSTVAFDGFMKVYQPAKEKILPELKTGDSVDLQDITPVQHFTEPPARYSDATLVKALEEHEIGRPSTYAPTIGTIIDREYVERDDNKKLAPTEIAKIVTKLLIEHFNSIVDLEFTAHMEDKFDKIAEGKNGWVQMLKDFYKPFHENIEKKEKEIDREDVMPNKILGKDPETGKEVHLRFGRFGAYVQLGEEVEGEDKPKRTSLLKEIPFEEATLEQALRLLELPKELGVNKEGEKIIVSIGPYGPYVKAGKVYASLKEIDPTLVDLTHAKTIIEEAAEMKRIAAIPLAELGLDPVTKEHILVRTGRFGPYVTDGETNASLGKKLDPKDVTLEIAVEMLIKKRERNIKMGKGPKAKKEAVKKKAPTKKKKATKKKPVTKKKVAKKK
jgi:DNA topoisomerase I